MATLLQLLPELFQANLARVQEEISRLATGPQLPTVVVVSKYLTAQDTSRLLAEGVQPLGESRAQDLVAKTDPGRDRECWHFIGHLQRNKVPAVASRISLLHSLDSERLAHALNTWLENHASQPLKCLVQVNVSGEKSKGGLPAFAVADTLPRWQELFPHLRIAGLMTMAPAGDAEAARPLFRSLRELHDRVRAAMPSTSRQGFCELSMGMSNDYRIAIQEGATLLRIGRSLFEPRTR